MKAENFHFGSDTNFLSSFVCTDWRSGHKENVGTFQQDICGPDTFFQTKNVGISSVHVFFAVQLWWCIHLSAFKHAVYSK